MNWLLDTNSIIYIQKGQVKESLPDAEIYISVITRMELLSFSNLDEKSRKELLVFLSSFAIVPLNRKVEDIAIDLRMKYKLKLPDAIITASAVYTDSIMISNDRQLEQITEINLKKLSI